jgi:hypothetical protein
MSLVFVPLSSSTLFSCKYGYMDTSIANKAKPLQTVVEFSCLSRFLLAFDDQTVWTWIEPD